MATILYLLSGWWVRKQADDEGTPPWLLPDKPKSGYV